MNKFIDYTCWITLAVVFDKVITEPLSIPYFKLACLLLVFGLEIESCFTNFLEARGLKLKISILPFIKRQTKQIIKITQIKNKKMKTSNNGIDLIKEFEGLRLKTYRCASGILTIGYGHTGNDVEPLMTISEAEAEKLLIADLKTAETTISRFVKQPLTQNQFDALVSFIFNVGANSFGNSTLLKRINANPYNPAIEHEFKRWVFSKQKKSYPASSHVGIKKPNYISRPHKKGVLSLYA